MYCQFQIQHFQSSLHFLKFIKHKERGDCIYVFQIQNLQSVLFLTQHGQHIFGPYFGSNDSEKDKYLRSDTRLSPDSFSMLFDRQYQRTGTRQWFVNG